MLRISQDKEARRSITLRLEGRVVGPWVAELRRACEHVLQEGRALSLQLADVEFMDANGVALLLALRSRGVRLSNAPLFVSEQLKMTETR